MIDTNAPAVPRPDTLTMTVGAYDAVCSRFRSVKAVLELIQAELIGEAPDDSFHRKMSRALDGAIDLCGDAADKLDAATEEGAKG